MECWISREALNGMVSEGGRVFPLETGGLLMGYWGDGSPVVVTAIGPGPKATHERLNFEPDYVWHTLEVGRLYKENDKLSYLGDWHTHPCGPSFPSEMDTGVLHMLKNNQDAQTPKPLMLILGNHLDRLGAHCLTSDGVESLDIKVFD